MFFDEIPLLKRIMEDKRIKKITIVGDIEYEEVQQIFATAEERKLHMRIEELEDIVRTLTMRVEALERNSIYLPQTNPPQITSPLEWSSKPHPWIRSSNRSDG